MKVRASFIALILEFLTNLIITLRIHFTEAGGESKRKEESSEEEDARKEAAFSKDARKEAYTKAQSMKSLFQQGQTITTKR